MALDNPVMERLSSELFGEEPEWLDDKPSDANRPQAWFLQISLVLLFVFVMISILFRTDAERRVKQAEQRAERAERQAARANGEISNARRRAEQAEQRVSDIESTDKGILYVELEQQLISVQRQKLLRALDDIEDAERGSLGHTYFFENNEVNMQYLEPVLVAGKLTRDYAGRRFAEGCQHAQQHLASPGRAADLEGAWYRQAVKGAALREVESAKRVMHNPDDMGPAVASWLRREIGKRIGKLAADTRGLHEKARNQLLGYYEEHPSEVVDPEVKALLDRYETMLQRSGRLDAIAGAAEVRAPSVLEQAEMADRIVEALFSYVQSVFKNGGAPLLQ